MQHFDLTEIKEPFCFIKQAMEGSTDEEILEAHQNYCQFLNVILKILHDQSGTDVD